VETPYFSQSILLKDLRQLTLLVRIQFAKVQQLFGRRTLNLEIYDHIKSRYDEDTMTYDQYYEEKKSADFFRKNFHEECNDQELLPCNCGKADRCNCHIDGGGEDE
jgi:hypothetical protein